MRERRRRREKLLHTDHTHLHPAPCDTQGEQESLEYRADVETGRPGKDSCCFIVSLLGLLQKTINNLDLYIFPVTFMISEACISHLCSKLKTLLSLFHKSYSTVLITLAIFFSMLFLVSLWLF